MRSGSTGADDVEASACEAQPIRTRTDPRTRGGAPRASSAHEAPSMTGGGWGAGQMDATSRLPANTTDSFANESLDRDATVLGPSHVPYMTNAELKVRVDTFGESHYGVDY